MRNVTHLLTVSVCGTLLALGTSACSSSSTPAATTPAAAGSTSTSTTATSTTASPAASTATSSPTATSTATGTKSYSMAVVADHNNPSSCWVAIDKSVYDLTKWINEHPGGPDKIKAICGTDATAAFTAQHGQDQKPHERLATFKIGSFAG